MAVHAAAAATAVVHAAVAAVAAAGRIAAVVRTAAAPIAVAHRAAAVPAAVAVAMADRQVVADVVVKPIFSYTHVNNVELNQII